MIGFNIIRLVARFLLLFVFRIKVVGYANMEKNGRKIVCANHTSNWDPVVLGAVSKSPLGFMAKAELFKNKFLSYLLRSIGAFPVNRGKGDLGAIKAAISRLHNEEIIAMFPEGTRVKKGMEVTPKSGAVMLAIKTKSPIVPINITSNYKWFSKVRITFGEPIKFVDYYDQKPTVEQLHELTLELMKTIKKLGEKE